jgi:curved DNA-binding protein CbpA
MTPSSLFSLAPSKFPGNPDATHAFQKVSVAYDVLSNPSSKRIYDSRPVHSRHKYDFFAQSSLHADETLKGVLLSVFSEFLEGDFEMIRTLLSECNPVLHAYVLYAHVSTTSRGYK